MKPSHLITLASAVAGTAAALRVLSRRRAWEQTNNKMVICVDFDDAYAAAIRAGIPFDDLLHQLAHNGATHLSLPELTLDWLRLHGELTPQASATVPAAPPPVGHWNFLNGRSALITHLASELQTRLPYTQAQAHGDTLTFAGDLQVIGEIGLGFDGELATRILRQGLGIVTRPVSYAWPEKALLERTLAQAAQLGQLVAFAGNMILGHEMHLDETLNALQTHNLTFVYFAESRHQKGDWFIAKRRAPHTLLGHAFTPQEMIPLDFHAAAHNWAHLARERGIRLCYVNFFRVLHATAPLEGLSYVHHLKHALEDAGFQVTADLHYTPHPIPAPSQTELALTGLAAAGAAVSAVSRLAQLPESVAAPFALVAAGGALALPFVEQQMLHRRVKREERGGHDHHHQHDHHHHDHDHHHHDHPDLNALYPPSYTPKLLGLAATGLAPIALLQASQQGAWGQGVVYQTAVSAALAALTSGQEYHLRIEEYKGFGLDWLLPLMAASWQIPHKGVRAGALLALTAGWAVARQRNLDVLALADPGHAEGHTHHISAATRLVGDMLKAVGPQPARKWVGLAPAGHALGAVLAKNGRSDLAALAHLAGTVGSLLGLVGFRRAERSLAFTLQEAAPSMVLGTAVGLALLSTQWTLNSQQ